jgi:hypothetical protein
MWKVIPPNYLQETPNVQRICCKSRILAMEQQAFVINNLPAKAQEKGFAVLYPEECFNGGGDNDDGSNDEEEPSDSEDNASECEEDIDMDEN